MELFNKVEAQEIVNNIIMGYNNYLQMRIEKKKRCQFQLVLLGQNQII